MVNNGNLTRFVCDTQQAKSTFSFDVTQFFNTYTLNVFICTCTLNFNPHIHVQKMLHVKSAQKHGTDQTIVNLNLRVRQLVAIGMRINRIYVSQ